MADQSFHKQAVNGVQAVIQGLGLTGISPGGSPLPGGQVYSQLLPSDLTPAGSTVQEVVLPAIIVSLVPKPETQEGTLTGQDDIGYAVGVTGLLAQNQSLQISDTYLYWRWQIRDALNHKRPAALVSALAVALKEVKWEPGAVIDLDLFRQANLWAWSDVYRVVTRETR